MPTKSLTNVYSFERFLRLLMLLLILFLSGSLYSNEADESHEPEIVYQDNQHCIYLGNQGKSQRQIFVGTKVIDGYCSGINGSIDLRNFNNPEDASNTIIKLEKLMSVGFVQELDGKCDVSIVGKYKLEFNNAKLNSISTFKENYLNDFVVFIKVKEQGEFKIKIGNSNSNSCRVVINKILS